MNLSYIIIETGNECWHWIYDKSIPPQTQQFDFIRNLKNTLSTECTRAHIQYRLCTYKLHIDNNTIDTFWYVCILNVSIWVSIDEMYRSHVQHSIHSTVCTDHVFWLQWNCWNRPLSSRSHYLLNQMRTKGDMLHCIYVHIRTYVCNRIRTKDTFHLKIIKVGMGLYSTLQC